MSEKISYAALTPSAQKKVDELRKSGKPVYVRPIGRGYQVTDQPVGKFAMKSYVEVSD